MEHFGDFLFQLMKHGTNTLHVAFIFLFSVFDLTLFGSSKWCLTLFQPGKLFEVQSSVQGMRVPNYVDMPKCAELALGNTHTTCLGNTHAQNMKSSQCNE